MRDYLADFGIAPFINAHDTITLYGASRTAQNIREAMAQVAQCFVDLQQLQATLGERIARLTCNEAAYITGGAAAGVQLCAAVCLARGDDYTYSRLPDTSGIPDEFIVLHGQHNCYDKPIEAAGGKIRLVGDADTVHPFELEGSITAQTAGVFYFPNVNFERASLPLEQVVEIAHAKGVPVVVDAAAQLPPVENLWKFTAAGADMVIFSGGKTLCGPQASGLVLGKAQYIQDCQRFGAPMHGVCRAAKAAREDMMGLAVAVENYVNKDHEAEAQRLSGMVDKMLAAMGQCAVLQPYRVEHGAAGQSYPRAFARVLQGKRCEDIAAAMHQRYIFIGIDARANAIYLNPLNLTEEECDTVLAALAQVCGELE